MIETESPYYKQGFKAYTTNSACAYSPMSTKGELWSMGWFAAQELHEEIADNEPASLTIEEINDLT